MSDGGGIRVLVTNDDGIDSPGLLALAHAAVAAGFDVVVAAPAIQHSGAGASVTATHDDGRIPFELRALVPDVACYAVEAAPALITLLAAHGVFGLVPDVVLSGINVGANTGQVVLHSGTVGAALTAGVNGARGLAVSLDVGIGAAPATPTPAEWDRAARAAAAVFPVLLAQPAGAVLNLNVPKAAAASPSSLPLPELREATLSEFGIVQSTASEPGEGSVRISFADPGESLDAASDTALLAAGFATLTRLASVAAVSLAPGLRAGDGGMP